MLWAYGQLPLNKDQEAASSNGRLFNNYVSQNFFHHPLRQVVARIKNGMLEFKMKDMTTKYSFAAPSDRCQRSANSQGTKQSDYYDLDMRVYRLQQIPELFKGEKCSIHRRKSQRLGIVHHFPSTDTVRS